MAEYINSQTDNITQVSSRSLIELAHPARSLSLHRARIRSQRSDAYRSRFKGRGMEYDESRLYQPGDDVRHLDWRVMARTGKAHTKLFCEERERPVYLWVDCCAPMFFATRECYKFVTAAKTAVLLAWSASHENDRVGGIVFTEREHHEVKPERGKNGVLKIIHYLSDLKEDNMDRTDVDTTKTNIIESLARLQQIVRPGSLIFFISDFRSVNNQAQLTIKTLSAHSETVLIKIYDPLEKTLAPAGEYQIMSRSERLNIDTSNAHFRQTYAQSYEKRNKGWQAFVRKLRAGLIHCSTQEEPLIVLGRNFGVSS